MSDILNTIDGDLQKETVRQTNELLGSLLQKAQYVGDVYSMTYETALISIHDRHRMNVGGIPSLCFLVASRKTPDDGLHYTDEDASVILLRVMDSHPLPQASEAERLRVEAAQKIAGEDKRWDDPRVMDPYTANLLSYAGVKCRIIGTFHAELPPKANELRLRFGSDISNYYSNYALKVYKPTKEALDKIVNYRDPDRIHDHTLGNHHVDVGRVRYASTNRTAQGVDDVVVHIAPADLLNMKTALFGMTRTGKSNTTKIIAKSVFELRYLDPGVGRVGQIIFDYNGEYANENIQDEGALKNIWKKARNNPDQNEVVTYGTEPHENDKNRNLLKFNFYADELLDLGKALINTELKDDTAQFVINFRGVNFDDKPEPNDFGSAATRYQRRVLAYRTLLYEAGFKVADNSSPNGRNLFGSSLLEAMRTSTHENAPQYQGAAETLAELHQGAPSVTWGRAMNAMKFLANFVHANRSGYQQFNQRYVQNNATGESWVPGPRVDYLTIRVGKQQKMGSEPLN